ncbi:hypothetical protein ACE6H2_027151 [Prunus campanulata]
MLILQFDCCLSSRICIVVFSEKYAFFRVVLGGRNSLREDPQMSRDEATSGLWALFYKVDPSDVQKGSFLTRHLLFMNAHHGMEVWR